MNADGSDARRLGEGSGYRWSPDSSTVAFQAERGFRVLVTTPGSTETRVLASGRFFEWAPDGSSVVVEREDPATGDSVIVLVPVDGSQERRLAFGHTPTWSPKGGVIAFLRLVNSSQAGFLDAAVFLIDVATGSERRLTGAGVASQPAWSADGRSLAYVDEPYVDQLPSVIKVLTLPSLKPRVVGAGTGPLVWSPRGATLAYSTQDTQSTVTWTRTTGAQRRLWDLRFGSWAPDGRRLILEKGSPTTQEGIQQLFLADLPGKSLRRIAYGWQSDWQERGEIVFARKRCGATQGLFVIGGAGSGQRRIADHCTLRGSPLADSLKGGPRVDTIFGYEGADVIVAGGGVDEVSAGPGDDTVDLRDGELDKAACGPGIDKISADLQDDVSADCEQVSRNG